MDLRSWFAKIPSSRAPGSRRRSSARTARTGCCAKLASAPLLRPLCDLRLTAARCRSTRPRGERESRESPAGASWSTSWIPSAPSPASRPGRYAAGAYRAPITRHSPQWGTHRVAGAPGKRTGATGPSCRALSAPARLVAEPRRQALVVRAEMLLKRGPYRLRHRRTGACVVPPEGRMTAVRQAEELDDLVVDRGRIGEEVIAVDHVDPVAAHQLFQTLELVSVVPAGPVAEVLIVVAVVGRVGDHTLGLAVQPGVFQLQGLFERLFLVAVDHLVSVLRASPLHWVTDQREQLHPWQVAGYPFGGQRVVHVVGRGLERHRGQSGAAGGHA